MRNEVIREEATVQPITTRLTRKQLHRYGHVRRMNNSHMTRTVLQMEVEGVRPKGRPTRHGVVLHGHHLEKYQEEWADGCQHS